MPTEARTSSKEDASRGGDTGERRNESQPARSSEEGGVAVAVDGAVRTHQPVARSARRPADPDDRRLADDALTRHGAEEAGGAVVEDAPVGGHQPVAPTIRGTRNPGHRVVEVLTAH